MMGPFIGRSLRPILIGSTLALILAFSPISPFSHIHFTPQFFGNAVNSVIVSDTHKDIRYHGLSNNGVDHFTNIFYAKDTSGQNRFAPPVRFIPIPGSVIDATAIGAVCPQGQGDAALPFTSPVFNVSENCLSLRISRPSGISSEAKLPVLVWIHGGGNILGTATDQLYEPDGLIKQSRVNGQPVIVVGINYRLGIFGYSTNKALRDAKSANVGLRDQRAALEWIKDNIEIFGGDSTRVTAVGQSVGASSIGLHLVSYGGKRGVPFEQTIMMSGASGLNFNIKTDLVANNTAIIARSLGCTDDFDSQATINCLRNLPMQDIIDESIAFARKLRPPFGELSFYPSYDGDYIPDLPSELLMSGQFVKDIPLIASWSANDGAWYPPPTVNNSASCVASFSTFVPGLSASSQDLILAAYPASSFAHMVPPDSPMPLSPHYFRAAQINRDMWFACPVVDFAWHYARQSPRIPVRLYEMNQTRFGPVYKNMGVPFWRVAHLSDIPYVLNVEDLKGGADNSESQRKLSRKVSGSVAAFAYEGDPMKVKGEGLGDWPVAFGKIGSSEGKKLFPRRLQVRVIGGPYGGGTARLEKDSVGEMDERDRAMQAENLFERCEIFNSLHKEISV